MHDVYNHDQDNDPTLHLKERDDKIQQQQKEIDLLTSELNKKEIQIEELKETEERRRNKGGFDGNKQTEVELDEYVE